jgi:hypothetical protein
MTRLVNFLLYQIGWFACVLGAASGLQWLGISIALGLLGIHLCLAVDRILQIKLALIAAFIGIIIDSAQLWAGVFSFPHGGVVDPLPPPFMTVLWMQFATTFRYSMSWLSGRYALAACFGFLGAPLAFLAGEQFGAIQFLSPRLEHFSMLACLWSCAVPLLVFIADRFADRSAAAARYLWRFPALPDSWFGLFRPGKWRVMP